MSPFVMPLECRTPHSGCPSLTAWKGRRIFLLIKEPEVGFTSRMLHHLWRDIRIGARYLLKTPLFTIFAALTLAIAIGANVIVFMFVNAIFLRPIEVPNPQTFVRLHVEGDGPFGVRYSDYLVYRDSNQSLSDLAAYSSEGYGPADTPVRVDSANSLPLSLFRISRVTGNLFNVAGVGAKLGRTISLGDTAPGKSNVVMLSEFSWKRYFQSDPQIIGRTIFINNTAHTVIGIAPDSIKTVIGNGFRASVPPFIVPLADDATSRATVQLVGRLKSGISKAQAQADYSRIAAQISTEKKYAVLITVTIGNESPPGSLVQISFFLSLFMSGVAVVLLIACDNIGILLLSRVAARRREIGIRLALGATRRQLVRQLVAENTLLSILGGTGAMIVALITARVLENLPSLPVPDGFSVSFDWHVVAFAIIVSLATTLLFGMRPAVQSVAQDVVISLNPGGSGNDTQARVRTTLVITQVTICTAMLITAAVLVRSQKATPASGYGFDSSHVLVGNINFVGTGYSPAKAIDFYEDLIDRLESTPGILSASVVDNVPIVNSLAGVARFGGRAGRVRVRSDNAETEYDAYTNRIMRGHFKTLMIPVLQGRDFSRQDRATSSRVGIINEALAGQLWPGESAIGRHVRLADGSSIEVVGVVKTSKYRGLEERPQLALYLPIAQQPLPLPNTFMVKTSPEPLSQTNLVRTRTAEIDPTLLLYNFDTLDNRINFWMIIFRILSYITGVPGAIAFVLGVIGTYGTMAFVVAQRRREIGVRIALGAHPSEALLLILRQGMKWTGAGVALGICGAFIATFWLSRYLERVAWFDPAAFLVTALLMITVAALACYIPARRASRVHPMIVLREE